MRFARCTLDRSIQPQRRQWHPTSVLLPGKSHGLRSLVGYCPWGHKESDTTERLHFSLSLLVITLNINGLSSSNDRIFFKKRKQTSKEKTQEPIIYCVQGTHFRTRDKCLIMDYHPK